MFDSQCITDMLESWAKAAEKYWYELPGRPDQGCYGSGYNGWGVQTNQKYLSAMSFLASRGSSKIMDFSAARALAALRYSLATHVSGNCTRTDGSRWGHTWISSLGIERMMFGVYMLENFLNDADRSAINRVIASEAAWLTDNYKVESCLLNAHGPNKPESNLWNGAICWRAAQHNPDAPYADKWREKARKFLINAVSIPEDIGCVERNNGAANFFSNYAMDHHGYFNVGYMVICTSNAAMLHFDMKGKNFASPAELHHHQKDMWEVLRRFLFSDGRLFRIGGDTRVRYAYCQDYLLPSLLYAADHLGEEHAGALLGGQLETIKTEFEHNGDGCFYTQRVGYMAKKDPLYYPRLESDKAGVLAMMLRYRELMDSPLETINAKTAAENFEKSAATLWNEPHYSSCMHRSPTRIASFTWHSKYREQSVGMGFCTPGDDGDICEWSRNLVGTVEPSSHPYRQDQPHLAANAVNRDWVRTFDGGFATCGEIIEGKGVEMAEGWRASDIASHRLAFIALPDDHTVVGLQLCKANNRRTYFTEILGMNLGIPNDMFNGFKRIINTESGEHALTSPTKSDHLHDLNSSWCNIEGSIAAIGLYGSNSLTIKRNSKRSAGKYNSLFVEQIGWFAKQGLFDVNANESVFDIGWMVLSKVNAEKTAALARANANAQIEAPDENCRAVNITACDGKQYYIAANFGDFSVKIDAPDGYNAVLDVNAGELTPLTAAVFVK